MPMAIEPGKTYGLALRQPKLVVSPGYRRLASRKYLREAVRILISHASQQRSALIAMGCDVPKIREHPYPVYLYTWEDERKGAAEFAYKQLRPPAGGDVGQIARIWCQDWLGNVGHVQ